MNRTPKTIVDALKSKRYCTQLVTGSGKRLFWATRDKKWIVTQTGIECKTLYMGNIESEAVRHFMRHIEKQSRRKEK